MTTMELLNELHDSLTNEHDAALRKAKSFPLASRGIEESSKATAFFEARSLVEAAMQRWRQQSRTKRNRR